MAVIAQSVGAVLVATWAHDYAPKIRCMVLASPAFKVKLYVPFARPGLQLQHKLRGNFFVNTYVKAQFLTHDPERIASYRSDPLITRPIAVNILLGLYDASERVVADARAITVPTQLLISGADWVVHHGPQHRVLRAAGHADQGTPRPAGLLSRHARRARPRGRRHARAPVHPRPLRRAAAAGPRCSTPTAWATPATRPTRWRRRCRSRRRAGSTGRWRGSTCGSAGCSRKASRSATAPASIPARPSTTSTATSRAGAGAVGRFIDRNYLESIGWRGIRQRKLHVEELLREAMERCARQGMPVRVDGHRRRPRPLRARGARRRGRQARLDPAARLQRHQRGGRRAS